MFIITLGKEAITHVDNNSCTVYSVHDKVNWVENDWKDANTLET